MTEPSRKSITMEGDDDDGDDDFAAALSQTSAPNRTYPYFVTKAIIKTGAFVGD